MSQLNRRAYRGRRRRVRYDRIALFVILILAFVFAGYLIAKKSDYKNNNVTNSGTASNGNNNVSQSSGSTSKPQPTVEPLPEFAANSVSGTSLSDYGVKTALEVNGQVVDSYKAPIPFNFGSGDDYTNLRGVISFRGNNFRNGGSYGNIGSLNIPRNADGSLQITTDEEGNRVWNYNIFKEEWKAETFSLQKGVGGGYSGAWTGSGWTGQPIIVQWDKETKQHMNMFDWAKSNDNMVEVIYATMDGHIYFLDLESGNPTRNKMNIGVPFKGAGSLDPRGIPILYLGAGDSYDRPSDFRPAKAMAINLLDCTVMYEFGIKPDSFALRDWTAYDSSALVCAENDSLVYPGENGILYVIKLNTEFDKTAGTLKMNPSDVIKLRYSSTKDRDKGYALGYEGSAAAFSHYVFLTENSGLMHCVDLNTMEVVWVQDIWDDTNSSPVFAIENGECYLYVGNTLDGATDSNGLGKTAFFKIKASTGEIVWKIERDIYTTSHITGGVMTSAVIGKNNLEGRAYIVFSSFSNTYGQSGKFLCINTNDGSIIWEGTIRTYAWSSPVAVYDKDGNGYIVQCNCGGNMYLIDGASDTYENALLDRYTVEGTIEATPAVFNDMIILGTRISGIKAIRIQSK